MTSEVGAARSELIDRLVEHAASNGLTDTSLRDLAAAVGTSHRMLNYHFGSRAGVVAAVVERIESQQRDALAEIAAEATSTTEIIERQWAQLSDPALAPFIRLFFEVTAQAMTFFRASVTSSPPPENLTMYSSNRRKYSGTR